MRKMIDDDLVVRLGLYLFEIQIDYSPAIIDFIQFGGIDFLQQILIRYEKHEFISSTGPKFLKNVLAIGAGAAIQEIRKETTNLQLCPCCAEALERAKLANTAITEIYLPKLTDRIDRVLMFMSNYSDRVDVICAGMDAVLAFSRNPDAKNLISQTKIIQISAISYTKNAMSAEVVWRIGLCYSIVMPYSETVADQLCKYDIHNLAARHYERFADDAKVQQQILWMLAAYMIWPRTYRLIFASDICMKLFRQVLDNRNELVKSLNFSVKDKYTPYLIVVPYGVRKFLRETNGETKRSKGKNILNTDSSANNTKNTAGDELAVEIAPNRNRKRLEAKPAFGTVGERMAEGEKGLLGNPNDADYLMKDPLTMSTVSAPAAADWEKHLQYGKPRNKNAKKSSFLAIEK